MRRYLKNAGAAWSDGQRDRAYLKVEKFIFISSFVVRKMIEGKKHSDEFEAARIPCAVFPRVNRGEKIDYMNDHHAERFYNFKKPRPTFLSPWKLCNALIHSRFFFGSVSKRGRITAVAFTSDRFKDKGLYEIELRQYFKFIQDAANDEVRGISYDRRSGAMQKTRTRYDCRKMGAQAYWEGIATASTQIPRE